MRNYLKIFVAICIACASFCATAMDEPEPETRSFGIKLERRHNVCCHWCRISKEKEGSKKQEYLGCPNPNCPMTFCGRATCSGHPDPFENGGCWVCKGKCCCAFKACLAHEKDPTHEHCFTHKRTLGRHANMQTKTWKKKKKKFKIIEGKQSEIKSDISEEASSQFLARDKHNLDVPRKRWRPLRHDKVQMEEGIRLKKRRLEMTSANNTEEGKHVTSNIRNRPVIPLRANMQCPSRSLAANEPRTKQSSTPIILKKKLPSLARDAIEKLPREEIRVLEIFTAEELMVLEEEAIDFLESCKRAREISDMKY